MELIRFLLNRSMILTWACVLIGILGGLGGVLLIDIINNEVSGAPYSKYFFIYTAIAIMVFRLLSLTFLARISEASVHKIREQLTRNIFSHSLRDFESHGTHFYDVLISEDVVCISRNLGNIPHLIVDISTIIGLLIYVAFLNIEIFFVILAAGVIGVLVYYIPISFADKIFITSREKLDLVYKHFKSVLFGFKELKLDEEKRNYFVNNIFSPNLKSLKDTQIKALTYGHIGYLWGDFIYFINIFVVIFITPQFIEIDAKVIGGYSLAAMYLLAPLAGILNIVPQMLQAGVSLKKVNLVLQQEVENTDLEDIKPIGKIRDIELKELVFEYQKENFSVGPINLKIESGKNYFIVGGNGSGKTTLAKVITLLYQKYSGDMFVNGRTLRGGEISLYQQKFGIIFNDFHLFEKILGINFDNSNTERINELIKDFRLDNKVHFTGKGFSTRNLSTGQRKRLALIELILSDKEIFVFDEWAADQDPEFKNNFYRKILPQLRDQGRTNIVITHDDRFFNEADEVLYMEYGKLAKVERHGK